MQQDTVQCMFGQHKQAMALKETRQEMIADDMPKMELLDLPTEIILHVLEHLAYPDALALKNTHSRLQLIISPTLTVARRVEWLIDRSDMGLPVPRWKHLNLRHNWAFTANSEVQMMLRRRRKHEDCRLLASQRIRATNADKFDFARGQVTRDEVHLDLRCTIDANLRDCIGIKRATGNPLTPNALNDGIPGFGRSKYAPRARQYTLRGLRCLEISTQRVLAIVYAVGAGLMLLNRHRLQILFRLWMLTEMMVVVAVIAHVFLGLEYQDVLDRVWLLSRELRQHTLPVSREW